MMARKETLTPEERTYLLALARTTIEHALSVQDPTAKPAVMDEISPLLKAPGATFVTLRTHAGELRGCIGSLVARRPLIEDVQENALAAAFRDPRFPPLQVAELPNIVVEISVLSKPEPLFYDDPEALIRKLRPGIDGVVLERGWNRATFLPQVWEQLPAPEMFLGHLCQKAGLPQNAWQWPDIKISTYQVAKFEE